MSIQKLLMVFLLLLSTVACAVTLGGKSVTEFFSDSNVVALTEAAMRGDATTVETLAKSGVSVNTDGKDHATPLLWALYVNNLEGMEALLKVGADPNQKTVGNVSALVWAAGSDKSKQLELLLKYGGNPNADYTGKIDDWPLSRAAAQGRLRNVELLLASGANINAHDAWDNSAAHKAVAMGNFEIVFYFLEHGYSYDLQGLARGVEIRQVPPESDRQRWKERVIDTLRIRGVKFPAFIPCYPPGDARRKEDDCKKNR